MFALETDSAVMVRFSNHAALAILREPQDDKLYEKD